MGAAASGLRGVGWWIIIHELLLIVVLYVILAKDVFGHYKFMARYSEKERVCVDGSINCRRPIDLDYASHQHRSVNPTH